METLLLYRDNEQSYELKPTGKNIKRYLRDLGLNRLSTPDYLKSLNARAIDMHVSLERVQFGCADIVMGITELRRTIRAFLNEADAFAGEHNADYLVLEEFSLEKNSKPLEYIVSMCLSIPARDV